ncbi:hypothetical protein AAG906_037981 [Vitis piasezkii]
MEHQAIVIVDESVKENEITGAEMRGMKSVSNGASSSMPQDERKENDEARHWHDEAHQTNKARLDYSLPLIEHRLGERRSGVRGPYYRGKASLIKFDEYKWFFLDNFPEEGSRPWSRLCGMVLLDGCFVVELLRLLGESGDSTDEEDPIFSRPWLIQPLIRDILKLENQLLFFILDSLFSWSRDAEETKTLPLLALKVFDLALPRSPEAILPFQHLEAKHLLHLFHQSLLPPKWVMMTDPHRPADQPMQCNRVLQIPSITINDFTSTLLINCVAWENCLINQPRDVAFLCSDGIISGFSQDDQHVTKLFKQLGKISGFKVRDCYLSEQVREIEAYYSSNWATMKHTYFSTPWSFISVLSAFILILLTMVQALMSVWSYQHQFG